MTFLQQLRELPHDLPCWVGEASEHFRYRVSSVVSCPASPISDRDMELDSGSTVRYCVVCTASACRLCDPQDRFITDDPCFACGCDCKVCRCGKVPTYVTVGDLISMLDGMPLDQTVILARPFGVSCVVYHHCAHTEAVDDDRYPCGSVAMLSPAY